LKGIIRGLLAIASTLFGLAAVVNLLYNLCGLLGVQDCASGPAWESALVAVVCAVLAFGAFYLSYRLVRVAPIPKDPT
jgi:hypothetical protein